MISINKKYIVVFVFLIGFVSQSFAAYDSCCSMSDAEMVQMDSSMHHMDMNGEDPSVDNKGCCEKSDTCPMSNCVPSLPMSAHFYGDSYHNSSSKIDLYAFSDIESENSTLFRPPVVR